MSAADQIFLQNRADAGEFFYGSPGYIGGAPGNIVQSGPGRKFTGDEAMFVGDPRDLIEKDEDQAFSFASFKEGIMDNPLFQGAVAFLNPVGAMARAGLEAILPTTNERAILERRAGDQGIAVDDIGRIAMQDFGFRPDPATGEMKYTALSYMDPSGVNIFQGYNLNKITQETIDERRANAKKKMSAEGFEKFNIALTAFEKNIFNKIKEDTEDEIKRREYIDREKKREKIQEDLTAAGFGEAGAVGLDPDMDKQIIDDYTYTPPSGDDKPPQAPPQKPDNVPQGIRESTPGSGEFGGAADYSSASAGTSAGKSSSRGRRDGGWGWKDGGLVRKPYSDGGIVDLL
jgi:hypothetical protein